MENHVIPFGSFVYGLVNELSDKDFIIISDLSVVSKDPNIEYFTLEAFKQDLDNCKIKAIEAYFTDIKYFNSKGIYFTLNKTLLRHEISAIVSNAYVKSKKKIIQGDVYVGLKSYYHCIRLLTYANSLAKNNYLKFEDHIEFLKPFYIDIISFKNDEGTLETFQKLDNKYKDILKSLRHDFKLSCPKN